MGEIVVKKRNRWVAFLAGLLALNVLPACQVGNRMTSSVAGSSSSEAVLEEESELEEQEENSESLSEEMPEPSGTEEPEIENRAAEAQEEEIPEEPDGYEIEDFPILWQMPELPTGCEITALTMTLQYYGFDVDKVTMAEEYLPTVLARFYYDSEGNLCGPDLNQYFVGDPTTEIGYICGTPAIVTAANRFLESRGSSLRAVDLTGAEPEELYDLVEEDIPVVVWITISMAPRNELQGWYLDDGSYVEYSTNDHGAVLIGYTEDTVVIADPLAGRMEYSREAFEEVFASRGNQCVILE